MNYHRVYKSNTSGEQEQCTLPEHLSARPDFSMISVTRSSVEDFRGHQTECFQFTLPLAQYYKS